MNKKFLIKLGKPKDKIRLNNLLNDLRPKGIFSRCSKQFRSIFLKHLLNSPLGIIIFAYNQSSKKEVGYVIAIRHPVYFWISLLLHYPFSIDLFIFIKKSGSFIRDILLLLKKFKKKKINHSANEKMSNNTLPNFTWSSSNPKIARIHFIGVLPKFRGSGLGSALYISLMEILRKEGCMKIEAHIDKGNKASLKLHQTTGWEIQKLRAGDYKAISKLL